MESDGALLSYSPQQTSDVIHSRNSMVFSESYRIVPMTHNSSISFFKYPKPLFSKDSHQDDIYTSDNLKTRGLSSMNSPEMNEIHEIRS